MTTTQPLKFEAPDQGEEIARADLYGLLASLFYGPPAQALLDTIAAAQAQDAAGILDQAWAALSASCKTMRAESVHEEYERLFIGVGKPEVMLYGSYYLSGFMMEKPLVELRTELTRLGLQRADSMPESEDHVAALCEVMRYLIASDNVATGRIEVQKAFFAKHMQPWVMDMCATLAAHPDAKLYASVADLARCFFEVEMQAFDMA
jgi:TorA maturation chaperone TorD